METENLDIVYFVKEGGDKEELRYSLRSVCKNMPHKRVWIFGGCPANIVPDVRVRVAQTGRTKWDKVRNMYRMVCENKEITDDFIMFHDDFFVMQPTDYIVPLHRCTLDGHIEILEPRKPTEYSRLLRKCRDTLGGHNLLSYEIHTPFVFNRQKLLDILNKYPDLHCNRTVYGNLYYQEYSQPHSDVKIFSVKPNFDYKHSQFLSTDDPIVNINNDVWRWIRNQFPKKCEYEI